MTFRAAPRTRHVNPRGDDAAPRTDGSLSAKNARTANGRTVSTRADSSRLSARGVALGAFGGASTKRGGDALDHWGRRPTEPRARREHGHGEPSWCRGVGGGVTEGVGERTPATDGVIHRWQHRPGMPRRIGLGDRSRQ